MADSESFIAIGTDDSSENSNLGLVASLNSDHSSDQASPVIRLPAFGTSTQSVVTTNTSSVPTIGSSGLVQRGSRSAFTPYRPTTILTNLQRGNVSTQSPAVLLERTIHHLAAQGELFTHQLDEDSLWINKQDKDGFTPLIWASAYGQLATVHSLISKGARMNIKGSKGETALLFASAKGHAHVVKELIKNGADVDHQDEDGNTALIFAAYNNHVLCTHELLAAGADFTKANEDSEMAYDLAVSRGSKQVQALLENRILTLLLSS